VRAPRAIVGTGIACAVLCSSFAVTGPWTFGTLRVRYWQHLLAFCLLALLICLCGRNSRAYVRELLRRDIRFRTRTLAIAAVLTCAFLLNICLRRYFALEVNAWDFSISFDRPIEQTLHGNLLWSDTLRMSMLGVHANWLMLVFVPLYAVVASPYWLLVLHPLAILGAGIALFLYARRSTQDDVVAVCLAVAFLLNRYTVRAIQLGFLIDVFYPLAFLLLLNAFRRSNVRLGVIAALMIVSIKEDAVMTLAGFAVIVAARYRAWRWAVPTLVLALVVFAIDYSYVIPGFRGTPTQFTHWWGSFGSDPLSAVVGMASDPVRVMRRVVPPAVVLLASMAFLPLAGGDWFYAALPALIVYTSADTEDLRWLALHYSLPLLGLMFASTADGIKRIVSDPTVRRVLALVVLLFSTFIGSGYKLESARSERAAIPAILAAAGQRPVYIQGAIFPHAGYAENYRVLHHDVVPEADSAFVVCTTCNPYPFSRQELAARFEALQRDSRYARVRSGDLWLFRPR
jgi:uncharacterized membrane protein